MTPSCHRAYSLPHAFAQARERRLACHAADFMHAVEFHTRHRRRLLTWGHGRRSFGVGIPHQVVFPFRIAKELCPYRRARGTAPPCRTKGSSRCSACPGMMRFAMVRERAGSEPGFTGINSSAKPAVPSNRSPMSTTFSAVRTRLHQVLCNALLIFDRIGASHDDVIRRIEACHRSSCTCRNRPMSKNAAQNARCRGRVLPEWGRSRPKAP